MKNLVELNCFCINREPKEAKRYHVELVFIIGQDGDTVYDPPVTTRYELCECYHTHDGAIEFGEEIVKKFSQCGVPIVHNKLYKPEIIKPTKKND